MEIFGVSGTNGAGKDSVGELLSEKYGFLAVSVSDLLREECRNRNLPIERENLRTISAEWRRKFGLGVLVDRAVQLAEAGNYRGVLAIPMRNVGEAERIHELGGKLIWVDADPEIRYKRITSRNRSTEDQKTFEQFLREEQEEMTQSGDEATLNTSGVKQICDIFLENNGNDIEVFKSEAAKILRLAK